MKENAVRASLASLKTTHTAESAKTCSVQPDNRYRPEDSGHCNRCSHNSADSILSSVEPCEYRRPIGRDNGGGIDMLLMLERCSPRGEVSKNYFKMSIDSK